MKRIHMDLEWVLTMKSSFTTTFIVFIVILGGISNEVKAQKISQFNYNGSPHSFREPSVANMFQFNGYTKYWHDDYRKWYRYGNLLKMSTINVPKTLLQSKINIAGDLGLAGLFMQPGFMNGLLRGDHVTLRAPLPGELKSALKKQTNVLVYVDAGSGLGRRLKRKLPAGATQWRETLGAHQYNSPHIIKMDAFYLQNGDKKLFVVASGSASARQRLRKLIGHTQQVLKQYTLKKGLFGVRSFLNAVQSYSPGFPLGIIGKGMNEGASWFVFSGADDFIMKKHHKLDLWLGQVNASVVTDLGTRDNHLFGCRDYKGWQQQLMSYHVLPQKHYFEYARKHGCYTFRPVYAPKDDPYSYDGYMARAGNKGVIDTSRVPFVLPTGRLSGNLMRSMVLFVPKGKPFTRKAMWAAIMDRRAVGVLKRGKMMGSARYRKPLDLLVLDRVYLEQYFGDRINLRVKTQGDTLHVAIENVYPHSVRGKLTLTLPSALKLSKASQTNELTLSAGETKQLSFKLRATASAMGRRNPIAVHFRWSGHKKGRITKLKLPPAISVYRLLYGVAPSVTYPVSIHNFTSKESYPVTVKVQKKDDSRKTVYQVSKTGSARPGHHQDLTFHLKVPPGKYEVTVSALGQHYSSQLGVGGPKTDGTGARVYTDDLNGDGIPEYVMENDSVKVTLLTTGARIIQYIVKSQHKNEFMQLWPKDPVDSTRAYRKHSYYYMGGFEDFLGQPSLETFKVYHAKIIKKSGDYVQVRMKANYFGNTITKTFTLYGNTPLVGIRYKINFKNIPFSNMLGPEPLLRLDNGRMQDIIIPTMDGIQHYGPKKAVAYGMIFDLKAGWNGGYSAKRNLSWIGAFPVNQPIFLHMWFNIPDRNEDSHYTYAELQTWVPIFEKSSMYYSYYMWGMGGRWEESLQALRKRNLITNRK